MTSPKAGMTRWHVFAGLSSVAPHPSVCEIRFFPEGLPCFPRSDRQQLPKIYRRLSGCLSRTLRSVGRWPLSSGLFRRRIERAVGAALKGTDEALLVATEVALRTASAPAGAPRLVPLPGLCYGAFFSRSPNTPSDRGAVSFILSQMLLGAVRLRSSNTPDRGAVSLIVMKTLFSAACKGPTRAVKIKDAHTIDFMAKPPSY